MTKHHTQTALLDIKDLSKHRIIENEAIVRKNNESVQKVVEKNFTPAERSALRLRFYCECSLPLCKERITLSPIEYKRLHRNRRRFIVMPGHEIMQAERVVGEHDDYNVVQKLSFVRVRHLFKRSIVK